MELCTRSGIKLHLADCYLEYARLYLAQGDKDNARESLNKASEIITATGYHRRDRAVDEIKGLL